MNLSKTLNRSIGLNKTVVTLAVARMGDAVAGSIVLIVLPLLVVHEPEAAEGFRILLRVNGGLRKRGVKQRQNDILGRQIDSGQRLPFRGFLSLFLRRETTFIFDCMLPCTANTWGFPIK